MGNKEFYHDMVTLSYDAINKLRVAHGSGTHILRKYEKSRPNIRNEFGVGFVHSKVREIGEILGYAELTAFLHGLKTGKKNQYRESQISETMSHLINDIKEIEHIFSDELCFLFYLNLNTIFFPSVNRGSIKTDQKRIIVDERTQEIFRLGSPRQRLMAILAKDKEIRQWFSTWIQDIIEFRNKASNMMSDFYKEINQPQKNIKKPLRSKTIEKLNLK